MRQRATSLDVCRVNQSVEAEETVIGQRHGLVFVLDRRLHRSRSSRSEPLLHRVVVYATGLLPYHTSAREDDEVGNGTDIEAGGELRVFFRVDLQHNRLARHVGSSARDLWRRSATLQSCPGGVLTVMTDLLVSSEELPGLTCQRPAASRGREPSVSPARCRRLPA